MKSLFLAVCVAGIGTGALFAGGSCPCSAKTSKMETGLSPVEADVQALTNKLSLDADQQAQVRAILEKKQASITTSGGNNRKAFAQADKDIQKILTKEQRALYKSDSNIK